MKDGKEAYFRLLYSQLLNESYKCYNIEGSGIDTPKYRSIHLISAAVLSSAAG